MPLILIILSLLHLTILHINGSTNPLGICLKIDNVRFYPKFLIKDIFGFLGIISFLSWITVFMYPNVLGHPDNYIQADALITPKHIVPEWYEWKVYSPNFMDKVILFMTIITNWIMKVVFMFSLNILCLITLYSSLDLLSKELLYTVKRLIEAYLNVFGSRKKFRFALKRFCSDFTKCIFFSKRKSNRCAYGTKIYNTFLNYTFHQYNNASKKLAVTWFLRKNNWVNKPCSQLHFSSSNCLVTLNLRKLGNCLFRHKSALIGCFVSSARRDREFSTSIEIDPNLNRLIVEKLYQGKWPSDDSYIKDNINLFIKSIHFGMLTRKTEQQLEYIESFLFDIKNRIYAIDKIFKSGKSMCYSQVGYSDLSEKSHKFILLRESKYVNISKLPACKIVKVEIPKSDGSLRSLGISMPIDKVLQQMFLTFLDVIVEDILKPNVFAYRKGRDGRMAVAAAYSNLNRSKYIKDMCICSMDLLKCFDNILHDAILSYFPFPIRYKNLLRRWLKCFIIEKKVCFKNLGRNQRGVPQGSILGPLIANFMLSQSFPKDILVQKGTGKNRKWLWVNLFSYADDLLIISNNRSCFTEFMDLLEKNLNDIGLYFNSIKTKYIINISRKVSFNFLGFEFIIMPRKFLKYGPLLSHRNNLSKLQQSKNGFGIILRPKISKFVSIKKKVKSAVLLIHHTPKNKLYKVFRLINSIVLGWAAYFSFSQGCIYAKRLDQLVFFWIKKALVKKFRYNGLIRPKWVAYNFMGLSKINPNGKAWQFQASKYYVRSHKISSFIYIWPANDTFSRLCITSFLLNKKLRSKSYYREPKAFEYNMSHILCRRLISDLKFRLYKEQNGLCLICKLPFNEKDLIRRSQSIHIHHLVPRSIKECAGKLYEARRNKILLHENCHLVLHKTKAFQHSKYLRMSVPNKPIIF